MNIRQAIIMILVTLFTTQVFGQSTAKQAGEAYSKGDYKQAIILYEELLKEGESAELYYNLGNAYYKDKQNTKAMINYERALLLKPNYSDAQFNLELAHQKVVDKIEPVDSFFLTKWKNSIQNLLSVDGWAYTSIAMLLFAIASFLFFLFSNTVWIKKIAFAKAIFFFIMVFVTHSFGAGLLDKLENRKGAIILTPSITVKSSPDQSGTDLFILHEGTKVEVKGRLGEWSEIRLGDGNQGWLPTSSFEVI